MSAPGPQTESTRETYLEGLRGLAALVVFFHHFFTLFYPEAISPNTVTVHTHSRLMALLRGSPLRGLYDGNFAVCIFFVLSGYVLTVTFFRTRNPNIIYRLAAARYFRLVIPAMASILLVVVLREFSLYNIKESSALNLAADIAVPSILFQDEIRLGGVLWDGLVTTWVSIRRPWELMNLVLWTMSIEFLGSMLSFGTAVVVTGLRQRWLVILVGALCFSKFGGDFGDFFCAFLLGVMLATRSSWSVTNAWWPVALLVFAAILGGYTNETAFYAPLRDLAPWFAKPDAMVVMRVLAAFLVMVAVLKSGKLQRALSTRPLTFLGKISFSLYLTHQPLMYSVSAFIMLKTWTTMKYHQAMALDFAVTAVLCVGVAYAMSRTIDRFAISVSRRAARFLVADEPATSSRSPRDADTARSRSGD
ncbi:MAG: acyltransferase [Myxococcales bacterium]|nr:acyltransferase [Myxococcales bacterium]